MNTEHGAYRMSCPLDDCTRTDTGAHGSVLLTIIVAMVLIGALGVAVVSLNSTGMFNIVSHNSNQNAYYKAEAGLRYAATLYKNTDNSADASEDDDKNADDDKRDVLENEIDGCTYQMPDSKGQFSLNAKTFWMYAKSDFSSASMATLYFSAGLPDNFDFPASGTFVRFDKNNNECTPFDFSNAVLNDTDLSVECKVDSQIEADDMIYLAFPVETSQKVLPGGNITLTLDAALESGTTCVPPRNGYFRILQGTTISDFEDRLLFYERAIIDGNSLTLQNIFDQDNTEFGEISIGPTSQSKIVVKKNLVLESTGSIGSESYGASRTVKYAVPVTDSFQGEVAETISFKEEDDLENNFASVNGEEMSVAKAWTAGGGQSLFATMTSIPTSSDGTKMGTFSLSNEDIEDTIDNAWRQNGYQLDYDVQVKLSNGKYLGYGGEGLSVRMRPSNGNYDGEYDGVDYDCLGVSMMKFEGYSFSTITTDSSITGTESIVGKTVEAWYNNRYQTHEWEWRQRNNGRRYRYWYWEWHDNWVQRGDATIKSVGENNKQIFVNNVNGSFVKDDTLKINGEEIGTVSQFDFGVNDMIPEGIKPVVDGKDLNGTLLLVLWQQEVQSDGSLVRRWLAYKELSESYDPYIQGPQGSYDGQIVHDNTSLVVRVREGYDGTTKVNKINVFYGDMYDTSDTSILDHEGPNSIAYDIVPRKRYEYGEPEDNDGAWNPQWPPRKISQWSSYTDYFSHVQQNGTSEDASEKYQWDGLNNSTDIDFHVFKLAEDGTITLSELVTPESDAYKVPEIGLHAFGDVQSSPWQVAQFNDFALLLFTPGYERGGFLSATAY